MGGLIWVSFRGGGVCAGGQYKMARAFVPVFVVVQCTFVCVVMCSCVGERVGSWVCMCLR